MGKDSAEKVTRIVEGKETPCRLVHIRDYRPGVTLKRLIVKFLASDTVPAGARIGAADRAVIEKWVRENEDALRDGSIFSTIKAPVGPGQRAPVGEYPALTAPSGEFYVCGNRKVRHKNGNRKERGPNHGVVVATIEFEHFEPLEENR